MTGLRLALFAAATLALAAPLTVQAQYNVNVGGETVVCESQDGNYRECRTRFYNAPVLVENLSSTQCL